MISRSKTLLNVFFLITNIAIVSGVYGQIQKTLSREIEWKDNITGAFYNSGDKSFLYFENAYYPDEETGLPYYSELIVLSDNSYTYSVKLANTVYETISRSDIQNVTLPDNIPNTIKTDTKVMLKRKMPYMSLVFNAIRRNNTTNDLEKLVSFDIVISRGTQKKTKRNTSTHEYASGSVLSSGNWVKIKLKEDGIYKISYSQLSSLGFDSPSDVRIFGNGGAMLPLYNNESNPDDLIENKVWYGDNYILFYGKGIVNWTYNESTGLFEHEKHLYSDWAYYFLTDRNTGFDNDISEQETVNQQANMQITAFNDYMCYEENEKNFFESGRQWFWNPMSSGDTTMYYFSFPYATDNPVTLSVNLLGYSASSSYFTISTDNLSNKIITITPSDGYGLGSGTYTFTAADESIPVTILYSASTASSLGWVDYVAMNAIRKLTMEDEQMLFRSVESVGDNNITQFTVVNADEDLRIWDVTEPGEITEMNTTLSGTSLSFTRETDTLREFVAFTGSSFFTPTIEADDLGEVENQDLHGMEAVDMIIVSRPAIIDYANELADLHIEQDNLSVEVVTPQQIYNEFSSGAPDVAAIRNFMRMLYSRSQSSDDMVKYLLLFGDGSYDNKSAEQDNSIYILTYQSEESINEDYTFTSDDFFGLLDEGDDDTDTEGEFHGLLDIGIGRFTVKSATEAQNMIDKIEKYMSSDAMSDWRNVMCFIADDADDSSIHMDDADDMADDIYNNYPVFNIDKIYLDAYSQTSASYGERYPDVEEAISERMDKGTLIIDYVGHGNVKWLADERILGINDIAKWSESDYLPFFITATCEFSRFDEPDNVSAGERIFLHSTGGGIGLFTASRVVSSTPNKELNSSFYDYSFTKDDNDEKSRLGDIIRKAKNDNTYTRNKRCYLLIGDPALQLSYPEYNIKTTAINGNSIDTTAFDTIKALAKVTMSGNVVDLNGQIISDFKGTVYPTVFDKPDTLSTLGNEDNDPMDFILQNKALFKGKASVTDGEFSFSFIVPKDISYTYGSGKISYYAQNLEIDANGYSTDFIIGGTADDVVDDDDGPEIELYLNDKTFVYGGMTDESPILLAYVSDSSGINTVGNGIGHDITVTVDDEDAAEINDSYTADIDSYQSGIIQYRLSDLEAGNHSLIMKVWDVYNNSSEAEIEFIVVESEDLTLKHVFNYPNPFVTNTSFYFEHNQPGIELDVLIQIFTSSGKLVKTIETTTTSDGYLSDAIFWDGLDNYGDLIGRGVYFYRLKVRNTSGDTAEKYEKLLIFK